MLQLFLVPNSSSALWLTKITLSWADSIKSLYEKTLMRTALCWQHCDGRYMKGEGTLYSLSNTPTIIA